MSNFYPLAEAAAGGALFGAAAALYYAEILLRKVCGPRPMPALLWYDRPPAAMRREDDDGI